MANGLVNIIATGEIKALAGWEVVKSGGWVVWFVSRGRGRWWVMGVVDGVGRGNPNLKSKPGSIGVGGGRKGVEGENSETL